MLDNLLLTGDSSQIVAEAKMVELLMVLAPKELEEEIKLWTNLSERTKKESMIKKLRTIMCQTLTFSERLMQKITVAV